MGVEAARLGLRPLGEPALGQIDRLVFSTTEPAYLDKTNATTIHAALRLDRQAQAYDANGSVRAATGALLTALTGSGGNTLVVVAGSRTGLPNSPDEREGGDGAAAFLIGGDDDPDRRTPGPVIAEYLGGASTTEEFVDRWRIPGEPRSRTWEERFGETRYVPLATEAWKLALDSAGVEPGDIARVIVAGPHARACRQVGAKLGAGTGGLADDLSSTVGNTGAAQAGLALAAVLDVATPGEVIALVSVADGADVMFFRTTDAIEGWTPHRTVAHQIESGRAGLPYLKFLAWNGMVTVQPPNRPEPVRVSSPAAARNEDWKYGFVGSVDRSTGAVHLPPARISFRGGTLDDMDPRPMADALGTVVTYTVDRLAYSPSPPIVLARMPSCCSTLGGGVYASLQPSQSLRTRRWLSTPMIVSANSAGGTFNSADGIQNYFWKAKPVR